MADTDIDKLLQREIKKNKKLEERFTILAKDKALLQKKVDSMQLSLDTFQNNSEAIAHLEELLVEAFGSLNVRTPSGHFDFVRIESLLNRASDSDLVLMMREECQNLKAKVAQLTERNSQTQKQISKL